MGELNPTVSVLFCRAWLCQILLLIEFLQLPRVQHRVARCHHMFVLFRRTLDSGRQPSRSRTFKKTKLHYPVWQHIVFITLETFGCGLAAAAHAGPLVACVQIAGLLFATHAVHVESVASIVGRAEIVGGLFALLSILAYQRVVKAAHSKISWGAWLVVTVLLTLCGTLGKEVCGRGCLLEVGLVSVR